MSDDMCSSPKSHPKCKFTKNDDMRLCSIISECSELNWKLISEKMGDRNPRQCKERWENYLNPNINRSPFSVAEDILLLEKYQEFGAKWVIISKFFNNRSDISIKSRYMVLKRRGVTLEFLKTHNASFLVTGTGKKARKSPQSSPAYVQTPPMISYDMTIPQSFNTAPSPAPIESTPAPIFEENSNSKIDELFDWCAPSDVFESFELVF
ncbi:Myb-like DNA-binding domain containing protein [Trichomonas vaginalis G3]|uniref:Myb-like DNA-binding domain containing protein n=1 Tax=Trichomonas vaginalis (strain ATCC PRA-98 / G3) TaxID=412133 RepID=A2F305_TRIV3|nr:RNA polymerase II transcription regulator recruiting protein [Trichomonas vaginalis G3]EAY00730.1 Myb-like DNA-binding domain containing protein [Trichomonas vaginalis G3]KAI5498512.1 RNA polymerase II transcription regulator recruiting protein [Trichomonas vaginalis G3]|eukprot:XP_001313659.1 Myb-like DNA-binding domain containing protein [Trichomonas vaginalis G3]